MAGNSPAVCLPVSMAFARGAELMVIREGNRVIVEPREKDQSGIPALFAEMGRRHLGQRPDFEEPPRNW